MAWASRALHILNLLSYRNEAWSMLTKKIRSFSGGRRNQRAHQGRLLKFYSFNNNVPESHDAYLNGLPYLKTQIYGSIYFRPNVYLHIWRLRSFWFYLFDDGRLLNGEGLCGRFNILFGFILISHALAGKFVGLGVLNVFGDGLMIFALNLRLFVKLHGVLLNAFLDAGLVKEYSDIFSLER